MAFFLALPDKKHATGAKTHPSKPQTVHYGVSPADAPFHAPRYTPDTVPASWPVTDSGSLAVH